jgi:hypothetical protein
MPVLIGLKVLYTLPYLLFSIPSDIGAPVHSHPQSLALGLSHLFSCLVSLICCYWNYLPSILVRANAMCSEIFLCFYTLQWCFSDLLLTG